MSDKLQSILETGDVDLQIPEIISDKQVIKRIDKSQCQLACPIDTQVKNYLGLIAAGEFEKAVEVVKRDNPFPGICGRVCIHPCENECERNKVDESVAICSLKRFLADYEFEHGRITVGVTQRKNKKSVAIVGSGPAGLTAAHNLALFGYDVTVYEALSEPGGMLFHGIPSFRLPEKIVRFEIDGIKELGVEIKTNTRIGKDISLEKLREDFDAVLLTVGAHKTLKPDIPGARENKGVLDFLTLLKKIKLGKQVKIGDSITIIGGDRPSIDLARSAVRIGCDSVTVIFSRSREEMPVDQSQITAAEEEGVKIYYHTRPVKILGKDGNVIGVECRKTEAVEDILRRKRPLSIKNSNFVIKADTITSTINREPDLSVLKGNNSFKISVLNTFSVDQLALSTNIAGVFAAGDCATGPKTTIEAIASGIKAAESIEYYLKGNKNTKSIEEPGPVEYEIALEHKEQKEKVTMPKLSPGERDGIKEVELGFSQTAAIQEAKRCLMCGPCMECDLCTPSCVKRLTLLSVPGESSATLLRIQNSHTWVPKNGHPLTGQLLSGREDQQPVSIERLRARVESEMCRGCGDCVEVCQYDAPKLFDQGNSVYLSKIDELLCRGCGVCPSVCPSSAIRINYFSDLQINTLTAETLVKDKIVGFICNWSFDMKSDVAEISGLKMIRVLCSARINPAHIITAFKRGAKGVLGIGCYDKACHYDAIKETSEHFEIAKNILKTLGIKSSRLKFERLSPDQPDKLDKLIRSFCKTVKELK